MKQILLIALAAVGTFSLSLRENQVNVSFEGILSHFKQDFDPQKSCVLKKCKKQFQGCIGDQKCIAVAEECTKKCGQEQECQEKCAKKHSDKRTVKNFVDCAVKNNCDN